MTCFRTDFVRLQAIESIDDVPFEVETNRDGGALSLLIITSE